MGNSHSGLRLQSSEGYSQHVQMTNSVAIELPGVRRGYTSEREFATQWTAKYTSDATISCTLLFEQIVDVGTDNYGDEKLSIFIRDNGSDHVDSGFYALFVQRTKGGHINGGSTEIYDTTDTRMHIVKRRRTVNTRGGITDTAVYSYGVKRKGLVVSELKWLRDGDAAANYLSMATVAHYFVLNTDQVFRFDETDIGVGLSVVMRIRGDKRNGDGFEIEGPVQHPAAALLFLFSHVIRTVSWTPNLCPHCTNSNPRQRRVYAESDSEEIENQQQLRSNRRSRSRSFLGNHGVNKGNGNGSVYTDRFYNNNFYN